MTMRRLYSLSGSQIATIIKSYSLAFGMKSVTLVKAVQMLAVNKLQEIDIYCL
jgi:Na+/proline symporter